MFYSFVPKNSEKGPTNQVHPAKTENKSDNIRESNQMTQQASVSKAIQHNFAKIASDLSKNNSLKSRMKSAESAISFLIRHKYEDIGKIYNAIKDLCSPEQNVKVQTLTFQVILACAECNPKMLTQYSKKIFLRLNKYGGSAEMKITILIQLLNGKFEYLGSCKNLLSLIISIIQRVPPNLNSLLNLLPTLYRKKPNWADPTQTFFLLTKLKDLQIFQKEKSMLRLLLLLIEAILSFTHIIPETLIQILIILCASIHSDSEGWKIMRNLLTSENDYRTLLSLFRILETRDIDHCFIGIENPNSSLNPTNSINAINAMNQMNELTENVSNIGKTQSDDRESELRKARMGLGVGESERDLVLKEVMEFEQRYTLVIANERRETRKSISDNYLFNSAELANQRLRIYTGALYYIGMASWVGKRVFCENMSFSWRLHRILQVIHWHFPKVCFEVLLTLDKLIEKRGEELEDELDIIMTILQKIHKKEGLMDKKETVDVINNIFGSIRRLYFSGVYYGDVDLLFDVYDLFKVVIKDTYLFKAYLATFETKKSENLKSKLSRVLELCFQKTHVMDTDKKLIVLNAMENFYLNCKDDSQFEILEEIFYKYFCSFYMLPLTPAIDAKILNILYIMCRETQKNPTFCLFLHILEKVLSNASDSKSKSPDPARKTTAQPKSQKAPDSLKKQETLPYSKLKFDDCGLKTFEIPILGRPELQRSLSLDILLKLITDLYLKFPVFKLLQVIKTLANLIKCAGNEETCDFVLSCFVKVKVDDLYFFELRGVGVPSFLPVRNVSRNRLGSSAGGGSGSGIEGKSKGKRGEVNRGQGEYLWKEMVFLSTQKIIDNLFVVLKSDNHGLVFNALECLLKLVEGHNGVANVNLNQICENIVTLNSVLLAKKLPITVESSKQIVHILHLLILMGGRKEYIEEEDHLWKIGRGQLNIIFLQFINNLDQIYRMFKSDILLFNKSANIKKMTNAAFKEMLHETVFKKELNKRLVSLGKDIFRGFSAAFIAGPLKISQLLTDLLTITKLFLSHNALLQKFSVSIINMLTNLLHSKFGSTLTTENITILLDISIQIGWRNTRFLLTSSSTLADSLNLFSLHSASILQIPDPTAPLRPSQKSERKQSSRAQTQTQAELISDRKEILSKAQLTFPGNQLTSSEEQTSSNSNLLLKWGDKNSGGKSAGREEGQCYLSYQNDNNLVMCLTSICVVRFFLCLDVHRRRMAAAWLNMLFQSEISNDSSPIICHSLVTYELVNWYATCDLERSCKNLQKREEYLESEQQEERVWLLNDNLLSVAIDSKFGYICLRTPISNQKFKFEIDNLRTPIATSEPILPKLEKLNNFSSEDIFTQNKSHQTEEEKLASDESNGGKEFSKACFMSPEFLISCLPFSVYHRFNYYNDNWEGLHFKKDKTSKSEISDRLLRIRGVNNEIDTFYSHASRLDEVPVYQTHNIAIIFISQDLSVIQEKQVYTTKNASPRFLLFLSQLGELINVTECSHAYFTGGFPRDGSDGIYGIVKKDELTQIFFHVNTLMQHINIRNPSKEQSSHNEERNLSEQEMNDLIYEKVKKYIGNDDVAIVWNENKQPLTQNFFQNHNIKIVIILTPAENSFIKINIKNLIKVKKKNKFPVRFHTPDCLKFGPLLLSCRIHENLLGELLLREVAICDHVGYEYSTFSGRDNLISNYMKRANIIKDIKYRTYSHLYSSIN